MKRRSKQRKYDIIIYSSLFIALICVVIGGIDYVSSMDKNQSIKEEVKDALVEIKEPEEKVREEKEEEVIEVEPDTLASLDKKSIVQKYIDEVYDQITQDEILTYGMVKTWKKYEVVDVTYIKEIMDYYYAYQISIKIYGENPKLPVDKDVSSTEDYTIIKLNANILSSTKNNGYIVKTIEIPQN